MRRALMPLLRGLTRPSAARLRWALWRPREAQARLRAELQARAAATAYGRAHGVARGFERLPVVDFEELRPWIERELAGEARAICAEPVLAVERTSGSRGASKPIPMTAGLRRSFSRMFGAWAHDLLARGPRLRGGRIFISISPRLGEDEGGFEDDSDYVEGWMAPVLRRLFVDTAAARRERDPEAFKGQLARALCRSADLEVISVWNPSFLEILLQRIATEARDIQAELDPGGRDARLAALGEEAVSWKRLWPGLRLISCWGAGAAEDGYARLAEAFPGVLVQAKGLLATEAPITIPLVGCEDPRLGAPLLSEVLIELEDEAGGLRPLWEAESGASYGLVISQRGGLSRVRLGDRVGVFGRFGRAPGLRFLGRDASVCDLVGEKLSEQYVEAALGDGLRGRFWTLLPRPQGPGYRLLTEPGEDDLRWVEAALEEAYHYRLARRLGQLAPLEVTRRADAAEALARAWMASGGRWGDMKARALHPPKVGAAFEALLREAP